MWYLLLTEETGSKVRGFVEDVLTFIILYNNLIPIRLVIPVHQAGILLIHVTIQFNRYHGGSQISASCSD